MPQIDRRLIAVGLVAGAAVGAWASGKMRVSAEREGAVGLIDWEQARGIAVNMNRGHALTTPEREALDGYYRALVDRCVPMVAEYTGSTLPAALEKTYAFDRVDWINANLEAFKVMFSPIEALNEQSGERSVAGQLWGGVNRTVLSAEVGLLLGYLARRVLGQYDLALLGREPVSGGKLYYVEPNIRAVEAALHLPKDEFRMWLALHETTHAFEFEANPWVRAHFNQLLERYFEFLKEDVDQLRHGFRGVKVFVDRARNRDDREGSWIEALMQPEQRALFTEMQALMCVVEGYSNHVMNAVGKQLLPSYTGIARQFEKRQRERGLAEQLFAKLTGLDMKLEQYRLGERFIDTIARQFGHETARRIWEGPAYLPTMDEIRQPERWVTRVIQVKAPATGPSVVADALPPADTASAANS